MASLNPTVQNGYGTAKDDEEEYYYEEEWTMTRKTRNLLIAASVAISVGVIYLFCFVLPLMFIPELRPLVGIVKVEELGVSLTPVSPETVAGWNFEVNVKDEDEDSEEDFGEEEEDLETSSLEVETNRPSKDRLVLVGDIHGKYILFRKLLRKIKYNRKTDHLLVLGDFIAKGPDSFKVLNYLIEQDADCILGNHEYYALQNYAKFHGLDSPFFVSDNVTIRSPDIRSSGFIDDPEFLLAKKLEPQHVEYINKCPLIKKLGKVPVHPKTTTGGAKSAPGIAVHAGLRWDVEDLNEQDPQDCLEMRSYLSPFYNETTDDPHDELAVSWSKVWNNKQKESDEKLVVYYGHDARRGLNIKKYAKGLDNGCVRGDFLAAMVIWQEKTTTNKGNKRILHKEQAVRVQC